MSILNNKQPVKIIAILTLLVAGVVLTVFMQTKPDNKLLTLNADDYLAVKMEITPSQTSSDVVRTQRNARFDNWNWVRSSVREGVTVGVMQNDWDVGLPALPVDKSSAVVIGIVRTGKAFLSNDQTGVYSEFVIEVVDWLKADGMISPEPKSITVLRPGGRVIYPSGQTVKYLLAGQEMPKLDDKYFFFLSKRNGEDVYSILTAYKTKVGEVQPLDENANYKANGLKFKAYEGLSEGDLRNTIFTEMGRNTTLKPE